MLYLMMSQLSFLNFIFTQFTQYSLQMCKDGAKTQHSSMYVHKIYSKGLYLSYSSSIQGGIMFAQLRQLSEPQFLL